jgi:hypothetical protein
LQAEVGGQGVIDRAGIRSRKSGTLKRVVPCCVAFSSLMFGVLTAGAQTTLPDAAFTVGNYPVEARAENAVAAKDRALADGQQAAFRSLLKRLVPVTAYQRLKRLEHVRAADLIEGLKVRSERNSSTEYIASLDFTFQAKAVRDLLRREGIPFVDEQAPPVVLVPVWRAPITTPAGAGLPAALTQARGEATWTSVWNGLDLEHTLTPARLQQLQREAPVETVKAATGGDANAIRALAPGYPGRLVVVAIAEPDPASKRLNVTLAGRDSAGFFHLRRSYRLDVSDPAYTAELAAVVGLGVLEGRWKAIKIRGSGSDGAADLLISVEFRGMGEWQDISRTLAQVPGVEELEVAGLSARSARITLRYPDGAEQLADELSRRGLILRNRDGQWMLHAQ